MKDQLGNAISASLAVGRDNGVTALRHDTPISVSQVEDEVMAGTFWRASRTRTRTRGGITEGGRSTRARAGRRK